MEMMTIRDVRHCIEAGTRRDYGPLKAFVVNFDADNPFPRKFYYHGCTHKDLGGKLCGRTVEGASQCNHNSMVAGTWAHVYRFDIFLVDSSVGIECPPLRVTCFNAACSLMGLSAAYFSTKPHQEQYHLLHDAMRKMSLVEVTIRVKDYSAIVQTLQVIPMEDKNEDILGIRPTQGATQKSVPVAETRLKHVKAKLKDLLEELDKAHI